MAACRDPLKLVVKRQLFMSPWSRYLARRRRQTAGDPAIVCGSCGFEIRSPDPSDDAVRVPWRDVARIRTYKLDLLTTDCICLLFELQTGAPAVQVSEEWPGFDVFLGALAVAFPSISASWYVDVMKPAFERNERVLYDARNFGAEVVV